MRRNKLPNWLVDRLGVAVVVLILAVGVILLGQRGLFSPISGTLLAPLVPVQQFVTQIYNTVYNNLFAPSDLEELRRRNAELEAQVAQLTDENSRLQEIEAQYRVVSALLDYARANPEQSYLAADVVGRDESLFLRYVLLNKGTNDGVTRDMPVVTEQGLVGVITEATANASKVLLITDASSAANVRLQESRAEGVVIGQESGELRLLFIPLDVEMKSGDRIITSGLGGTYPPGLVVGTVASVRRRTNDVSQEADVRSAIDFNQLETVLIITSFKPPELAPLLGTPAPP
ncbi:MAG TPA: rod shape-determining protein MreC [Anaerolineales bacterium]|nr:rod shape-determining protein MreC [Anaerolineales bacterium]